MMRYKGYFGKVEYDDEARILHGEVLGIKDVITFQADKASKIEKAFHESVDDYLAFCKERGEHPEKPYSGKFMLRIDPAVHRRISVLAEHAAISLNTWINLAIAKAMEDETHGAGTTLYRVREKS